ncbi:hypothetical protein RIF29_08161 [Crotalaria pallida]|uniref:RING-type E3 ubiquitin transferase n=1 Tax=Crotalaria pallida TaxID=3830 RepID=A0AAN9PB80_CROPI
MGISWSSNSTNTNTHRRRRNSYLNPHQHLHQHQHQHPYPPHLPPPYYYPPHSHSHLPPPQGYYYTSSNPSTTSYMAPPPPQQQQQTPHPPFYFSSPSFSSSSSSSSNINNNNTYNSNYAPNSMPPPPPFYAAPPPITPPPYVDHLTAKKIRNDVNLHKHTLRLQLDHLNPDHHLVSFVFDALFDGSITISYMAKEEEKCRFVPLYPDAFEPITFPFQKGVGQKFCQPSGTGIDLGFFELDDLSKPSPDEDVFPLVICAETRVRDDETHDDYVLDSSSPHMQITQAVLEKSNGSGPFQVKVVRQILWIDNVRYELRELYGIGGSAAADFDDNDPGKECVICMTEPKDTAVLPCRHMCMCSECAKALRHQSNKCPICRQPIEELIEIKISNGDQ